MKSSLSNYKQSPRKIRLVTELVKGKSVADALIALKFLEKRGAAPIAKLIASAAANAEKLGENTKDLIVKSITVNKGLVRVTQMPRAFGRATPLKHRHSHVDVVLGKAPVKKTKARSATKK